MKARTGFWLPITLGVCGLSLMLLAGRAVFSEPSGGTDQAPPAEREASIVQEHGSVFVRPGGQESYYPAQIDTPLESGDTVQTGTDGDCDITLDGSSLLHLDKGTELGLNALAQSQSVFTVSVGGILGKIVGDHGQPANMEFRTPPAWGGLRGTEIGVETDGRASRFGVFDEGKFGIHQDGGAEVLLTPHMELSARAGEPLGAAGPMRSLLSLEKRMAQLRQDREAIAKAWKPGEAARRRELRQKLLAQKPFSGEKVAKIVERARQRAESRLKRDHGHERSSHPQSRPERGCSHHH